MSELAALWSLSTSINLLRYHWGFLIRPKAERNDPVPGARYHVENPPSAGRTKKFLWRMSDPTKSLLARIIIGKIVDEQHPIASLRRLLVV